MGYIHCVVFLKAGAKQEEIHTFPKPDALAISEGLMVYLFLCAQIKK